MSKIDHSLFDASAHALDQVAGPCPQCGGKLVIRHVGKHSFIGCSSYPACDYSKPLKGQESSILKVLDQASCPQCGAPLAVKQGRYGMFIGCTAFPACHYIAEDQDEKDTDTPCPSCHKGELLERVNRFGKTFYSCDQYPHCKYVLNDPPVAQSCPKCGWGLMVKKTLRGKAVLQCPAKGCGHIVEESN
ncbi:topoisomerase DNA-binding C4 zinc finger domain-containing protein [Gallaecimonas kandeliae]|uniref:DNA topoisomerase family protein n=1 Tax=Gallaecimonas kandeliae TaxID=3029055 RepID=UPI0026471B8E|nr:topoisomerase DNA-binding C4 zinc finger domain-containing protein [Gallaecimonas kandeliae]WKE65701.1 topoisomerase DNA-binding C4 zinc finger domain-containing protein [Gallaecimonas kandeliae]